jgi:pimeloyl-ACP methyl ester carboxylesterase
MQLKKPWKWLFGIFLLISPIVVFDSCMQFRMSSSEIKKYFSERGLSGTEHAYRIGNRTVNYIHAGDESLPLVVFVHGSPGSLSAFIHFLADSLLVKQVQLVSVDRPGFGASNFGNAEPSLAKQALLLKPILEKFKNNQPVILVGHSLGGPVIARMAMDFPELVDGLVMVAPSIDPELEPKEWFRGPLALPFLKWILPRSIRASNDEIWNLKPELQAMMPMWSKIEANTIVIQGGVDTLVPPGNADFAKRMITNAPVEIVLKDEMNHFVPWNNPQLIREAILKLSATSVSGLSAR